MTRYAVRYRLGGGLPMSTRKTSRALKEAEARRDLVGGLIAAGRKPRRVADALQIEADGTTTFAQAAASYQRSRARRRRPSHSDSLDVHIRHLDRTFAATTVESITAGEIQECRSPRPTRSRRHCGSTYGRSAAYSTTLAH